MSFGLRTVQDSQYPPALKAPEVAWDLEWAPEPGEGCCRVVLRDEDLDL